MALTLMASGWHVHALLVDNGLQASICTLLADVLAVIDIGTP